MGISELFKELDAPLHNIMWSWGAIRELDKTVFLRVWQEGTAKNKLDKKYYTWICDTNENNKTPGKNERRRQVSLIKNGYRAYMIMCESEDGNCEKIKDYNAKELLVGGQLIEIDGAILLENIGRIPVQEMRLKK